MSLSSRVDQLPAWGLWSVGATTKEFMKLEQERLEFEDTDAVEPSAPPTMRDAFRPNQRQRDAHAAAALAKRVEELSEALADAHERIAQLEESQKKKP